MFSAFPLSLHIARKLVIVTIQNTLIGFKAEAVQHRFVSRIYNKIAGMFLA